MAAAISVSRRRRFHGELPDEILDAQLLKAFPGRTLEELDGIDYARYLRARQVQQVWDVEDVRTAWIAGKMDAKKVAPEVLEMIAQHDSIMGETTDVDDGDE